MGVFCAALANVQKGGAGPVANCLVQTLQSAIDDMTPDDVPGLVEAVIAPLSERRGAPEGVSVLPLDGAVLNGTLVMLDLLPKLLARVATKVAPLQPPERSRLTRDLPVGIDGPGYARHAVRELNNLRWPLGCQIKIIEVLKDMLLPLELLQMAATKAARQLKEVPLDDLPALVYQLLLLGAQQSGSVRDQLLRAIIDHFNNLDSTVKGTHLEASSDDKVALAVIDGRLAQVLFHDDHLHGARRCAC